MPPSGCARPLRAAATQPKLLNLGSATDAYQPVERRLRITRAVIEVLAEHRAPVLADHQVVAASSATST